MRSELPAKRNSAPNAVRKKPFAISASLKVLRSATRRLVISGFSCACVAAVASATDTRPDRNETKSLRAVTSRTIPARSAPARRGSGPRGYPYRLRYSCSRAWGLACAIRSRGLGGKDGVDGGARAFHRGGQPRDFRGDIVDALAQQR